jgi:hypothetical protein
MSMDIKTAVRSLSALAQESRLAIFRTLVQAGPTGRTAGQLAQELGISPSALTFHMKELVHADLASSRQEGRFVIHSAKIQAMNTLLEFLTENCCGGNPCSPITTVTCGPGQTADYAS